MIGCLLLSSEMACYISEECVDYLGQGLLGCMVLVVYLVLYE